MAKACRSCAKIFWKAFRMESCFSNLFQAFEFKAVGVDPYARFTPSSWCHGLPVWDRFTDYEYSQCWEHRWTPPFLHHVASCGIFSNVQPDQTRLSSHNFNQFTLSLQCVSLWRKWPSKKENMCTWSHMNSAMWFSYIFMRSSKRLYAPTQLEPHGTTRGDLVHILMQRHLAFREGRSARSWDLVMLSID